MNDMHIDKKFRSVKEHVCSVFFNGGPLLKLHEQKKNEQ